jgi:hypothetical protein
MFDNEAVPTDCDGPAVENVIVKPCGLELDLRKPDGDVQETIPTDNHITIRHFNLVRTLRLDDGESQMALFLRLPT